MKNLLTYIFIISQLLLLSSCTQEKNNNKQIVLIDNDKFEFELPYDSKEIKGKDKELFTELNHNLIYLAICDSNNSKMLLFINKQTFDNKLPMEEVFVQELRNVNQGLKDNMRFDNLKLIDFKVERKQGKLLRNIITSYYDSTFQISYYFMKDDHSNVLYEINTFTDLNNYFKVFDLLEWVALTVRLR